VLTLLGEGRTNAEIGATLYISPKTASVHVTNILRKLASARGFRRQRWPSAPDWFPKEISRANARAE
jgi:hypothetical protein